jgi:hypothetical protein
MICRVSCRLSGLEILVFIFYTGRFKSSSELATTIIPLDVSHNSSVATPAHSSYRKDYGDEYAGARSTEVLSVTLACAERAGKIELF